MGKYELPQPIKLSDSGPPPNANFYPAGKKESYQGIGSPQNRVLGNSGDEYTDLSTGDIWNKLSADGFSTGWNLTFPAATTLEAAGLRVRNGSTQYYNSTQSKWIPFSITGEAGAEQVTFGDADLTP